MASEPHQNSLAELDEPKIILGVAAHPDDLEFMDGGSIALWTSHGAQVYYLILTNGNKGSLDRAANQAELVVRRQQEQRAAAAKLGVADVFFCDYEDGELAVSLDVKRDIARAIRRIRPDTILVSDPSVVYYANTIYAHIDHPDLQINHPDHRAAGQATLDAVYPHARDHLSFPELLADGLEPHAVKTVLLSNFDRQNYYVDITDTIDQKIAALQAHSSQISDNDAVAKTVQAIAAETGKVSGHAYAEGFVRLSIHS